LCQYLSSIAMLSLCLILFFATQAVTAFQVSRKSYTTSSLPQSSIVLYAVQAGQTKIKTGPSSSTQKDEIDDEAFLLSEEPEVKGVTNLVFEASKTFVSESNSFFTGKNDNNSCPVLTSFLLDATTSLNLLKGEKNPVELIDLRDVPKDVLDSWAKECTYMGASVPLLQSDSDDENENGERMFCVKTGINFPGLKIISNNYIGSKRIYTEKKDEESSQIITYPTYEFVSASTESEAEGSKLLVWIYKRLSGGGSSSSKKKENGQKNNEVAHSYSRFTVKPTPDGRSFVFQSEATLQVSLKFPSILLKILPVSKEKAEQQGSESLVKALEKDILPGLERLRTTYLAYSSDI